MNREDDYIFYVFDMSSHTICRFFSFSGFMSNGLEYIQNNILIKGSDAKVVYAPHEFKDDSGGYLSVLIYSSNFNIRSEDYQSCVEAYTNGFTVEFEIKWGSISTGRVYVKCNGITDEDCLNCSYEIFIKDMQLHLDLPIYVEELSSSVLSALYNFDSNFSGITQSKYPFIASINEDDSVLRTVQRYRDFHREDFNYRWVLNSYVKVFCYSFFLIVFDTRSNKLLYLGVCNPYCVASKYTENFFKSRVIQVFGYIEDDNNWSYLPISDCNEFIDGIGCIYISEDFKDNLRVALSGESKELLKRQVAKYKLAGVQYNTDLVMKRHKVDIIEKVR